MMKGVEPLAKRAGGADGGLTAGPADVSWGLLARLRGGFGELGGVREAHTRWSIWYSSCCGEPKTSSRHPMCPGRDDRRRDAKGRGQPF